MTAPHTQRRPRDSRQSHPTEAHEGPFFAALDLGTNNCRLMIARPEKQRLKVLDSFSQIVRLGEGMSQSGELSDEAMQRTLDALHHCADKLAKYEIRESHFVATEACRRARNGEAFVQRIADETGIELTIITQKDEAVLAFLGCSPLIDSATDYTLMLDIGGGSTEMMLVDMQNALSPKIIGWQSLPIGVMTAAEEHLPRHVGAAFYDKKVSEMGEAFHGFMEKYRVAEIASNYELQMICCSGTVTTIGAVHKNLPRYDRREVDGMKMTRRDLHQTIHRMLEMPHEARAAHPCIGADRADFLLAGCGILQAAVGTVPVEQITVGDRGVREGILLSLFQKHLK